MLTITQQLCLKVHMCVPGVTMFPSTAHTRQRAARTSHGGAYLRFAVLQLFFLILFFFVVRFTAEISEAHNERIPMNLHVVDEESGQRWPGAPGESSYTADLLLRTRLGGTIHSQAPATSSCNMALPMLALSGVGTTTRMLHNVLEFAQDPFVRIYIAARSERDARAIYSSFHALPATLYSQERQRELVIVRVHLTTSDHDRLRILIMQALRDHVQTLLFVSPSCFFQHTWTATSLPREHAGLVWMPLNATGRVPAATALARLRAGVLLTDAHHGSDKLLTCGSLFLQVHA